jgi:transcriptional regulator with XRE-family HTH domain
MTLNEYVKRKRLTHDQFAASVGCTRAAVTRWLSGSRAPSPKWVVVILRKTKGLVKVQDLRSVASVGPGFKLHDALVRRGLTIREAAKLIGISRNTLAAYIKDSLRPTKDHAQKIKRQFGVTL